MPFATLCSSQCGVVAWPMKYLPCCNFQFWAKSKHFCRIFRSFHQRNRRHHLLLPRCLCASQDQLLNWGLKMTTPANCSHGDQSLTTTGDAELELTKPFLFVDVHKLDHFCQSIWAYLMKPISQQFTFIDFVVTVKLLQSFYSVLNSINDSELNLQFPLNRIKLVIKKRTIDLRAINLNSQDNNSSGVPSAD